MEVRNCRSCGKLYNYIGPSTPVCPACMKAMDEKYEQVKKYIYDNPRCNINQVAEDNEVSVQQIQRWVREERLSFSEDSDIGIECENCGKMIKTGRFCNECKSKLKMDINGALPVKQVQVQKKVRESARMRFLDT